MLLDLEMKKRYVSKRATSISVDNPNGLKGDEIALEARIVTVADVIESMATSRPYRHALGLDKALEEIEQHAGTLYDKEVVAAALSLFREKGYQLTLKV